MKLTTFILIILTCLLQANLWFGDSGLISIWHFKQRLQDLKQENAQLAERNAILTAEIMDLQKGLAAVEEKARSEYGLVKKSEIFYQILPQDGA